MPLALDRAQEEGQMRAMASRPLTLYEKIWDAHVVERRDDGTCLIYIDRHLIHEVTSPQAFDGLRAAGRAVRRPDLTWRCPTITCRPRRGSTRRASACRSPMPRARRSSTRSSATPPSSASTISTRSRPSRASSMSSARTGLHPARHHPGLRRQPHLGAWRDGRAGVRHRHQRGRTCTRHADPVAEPVEDDGGSGSTDRSASGSARRT